MAFVTSSIWKRAEMLRPKGLSMTQAGVGANRSTTPPA